jgi:hypothetical protein
MAHIYNQVLFMKKIIMTYVFALFAFACEIRNFELDINELYYILDYWYILHIR